VAAFCRRAQWTVWCTWGIHCSLSGVLPRQPTVEVCSSRPLDPTVARLSGAHWTVRCCSPRPHVCGPLGADYPGVSPDIHCSLSGALPCQSTIEVCSSRPLNPTVAKLSGAHRTVRCYSPRALVYGPLFADCRGVSPDSLVHTGQVTWFYVNNDLSEREDVRGIFSVPYVTLWH
jgi:hypothetical protein